MTHGKRHPQMTGNEHENEKRLAAEVTGPCPSQSEGKSRMLDELCDDYG